MSIFEILNEVEAEALHFHNHPGMKLEQEGKAHYLNCLAVAMNADEKISEEEKGYFTTILVSFGGSTEPLDGYLKFAESPDKGMLIEAFDLLGGSNIKYSFMIDCLMLLDKGNGINDKNRILLDKYYRMLHITKQEREQLAGIYKTIKSEDEFDIYYMVIRNKDIPADSYLYLFEYFSLNFEQIEKNIYSEIEEDLKFEFVTLKNCTDSYGSNPVENKVTSELISNKIFGFFLQILYDGGKLSCTDKIVKDLRGHTIINLELSSIDYKEGDFLYGQDQIVEGISPFGAVKFVEWINNLSNKKYLIPEQLDNEHNYYVSLNVRHNLFYNKKRMSYVSSTHSDCIFESDTIPLYEPKKELHFRLQLVEAEKK